MSAGQENKNKPANSCYQCSFCREHLKKVPLKLRDFPSMLLLLRPYRCPHCFEIFHRPYHWLSLLLLVKFWKK